MRRAPGNPSSNPRVPTNVMPGFVPGSNLRRWQKGTGLRAVSKLFDAELKSQLNVAVGMGRTTNAHFSDPAPWLARLLVSHRTPVLISKLLSPPSVLLNKTKVHLLPAILQLRRRSLLIQASLGQRNTSSFALPGLDMPAIPLQPDFGKDGSLFPPLPKIHNPKIRMQVFTHRSFFARPIHVFEDLPEDPSPDNEKMEHLGDTVLGLTITSLLMEMFPGLRVGPSTKIRAMVVGNSTLAEISLKYKLPDHLRLHPAQAITLRASTNIQADVFEAFIGGLHLDQGIDRVRPWIYALFAPYAISAYKIARQQHSLSPMPPSLHLAGSRVVGGGGVGGAGNTGSPHPEPSELLNMPTIGHLALFNQQLQRTNRQVEWIYSDGDEDMTSAEDSAYARVGLPSEVLIRGTKATPVWYVKVMVDGQYYGRGRGNTKKSARNEAAKEGLKMLGIDVW